MANKFPCIANTIYAKETKVIKDMKFNKKARKNEAAHEKYPQLK
jgi:hypothetical protein